LSLALVRSAARDAVVPAARSLSEYDAAPRRVVIHDPAGTSAFAQLGQVPADRLEERYLFRAAPDRARFAAQHTFLATALTDAGVNVVHLGDQLEKGGDSELHANPNHVYTRDSAITLPWLPGWFIRCAMRKPIRRAEPGLMAFALNKLGLQELFSMPQRLFLEGGDVIPLARKGRRTLLVGFGPRTNRASISELIDRLLPWAVDELIAIELVPERMNLDGVLVPVANDTVLVDPSSIVRSLRLDADGEEPVDVLRLLRSEGMTPLEVSRAEATTMQACNCVCLGDRQVIAYDLCKRVIQVLQTRDIHVHAIPAAELIKGTGGPRCMTRPLYV
jgi:N-dimethylarginine dimethylaminohydrolase